MAHCHGTAHDGATVWPRALAVCRGYHSGNLAGMGWTILPRGRLGRDCRICDLACVDTRRCQRTGGFTPPEIEAAEANASQIMQFLTDQLSENDTVEIDDTVDALIARLLGRDVVTSEGNLRPEDFRMVLLVLDRVLALTQMLMPGGTGSFLMELIVMKAVLRVVAMYPEPKMRDAMAAGTMPEISRRFLMRDIARKPLRQRQPTIPVPDRYQSHPSPFANSFQHVLQAMGPRGDAKLEHEPYGRKGRYRSVGLD